MDSLDKAVEIARQQATETGERHDVYRNPRGNLDVRSATHGGPLGGVLLAQCFYPDGSDRPDSGVFRVDEEPEIGALRAENDRLRQRSRETDMLVRHVKAIARMQGYTEDPDMELWLGAQLHRALACIGESFP